MPPGVTLVAYGDPRAATTWSGTPRNILNALTARGCAVAPVNSLTSNKAVKLAQLARHWMAFGNRDFRRGPVARAYAATRARAGIDAAGNSRILHTSLHHLPLAEVRPGERHFLYLDLTYDMRVGIAGRALSPFEAAAEALDRRAYAQIVHFFAISACAKENLVRHYGIPAEKISVVGTGFSTGFIRPCDRRKDYGNGEILFSSKIPGSWEHKGGALLLAAFELAHKENPRLRLTLVGHESYKKHASGVPGVTAYGYVSWDKLQELFDRAALYAMPALQEPWGVVYLEALACKTPILGLDRYGFPEIAQSGKYGFLCPEATPESVAETLLAAMADPARLAAMGEAGQAYVTQTFSWEKVAKAILDGVAA